MRAKGRLLGSIFTAMIVMGSYPALAQVDQPVPSTPQQTSPEPQNTTTPPVSTPAPQAQQVPDQNAAPAPRTDTAPAPAAAGNTADTAAAKPSEPELPPAPEVGTIPGLPHNLSPWGMFMAADIVVKGVMLGLAFASLVTWTIWLAKTIEIAAAKAAVRRVMKTLVRSESLYDVTTDTRMRGFGRELVRVSAHEVDRSEGLPADGIKERVVASLTRTEAGAARRMTRGMGVLATIGSTAPFVGLFGTVWGIMNSFIGIAESQTTNLAVVAPGIAEALLATAIGLVAAIPAVVIYNVFTRSISGYRALLADASAEIMKHVSRDLDRARLGRRLHAAE
jgi:biopolymer transport protein ExbB